MKQSVTIKKILNYIRRYWFMVALSIFLAAVTVVLTLYIPILTGDAVDLIVEKGLVDMAGVLSIMKKIAVVMVMLGKRYERAHIHP